MYFLKNFIKQFLINSNYDTQLSFNILSTQSALRRCLQRGTKLNTVLDIGASDGRWSGEALKYYPAAFYYLIDAQPQHEPALSAFKGKHKNSDYLIAAAGDTIGEIYFDAQDLFGGVASHHPVDQNSIRVPVTTIDTIVTTNKLQGPFLIKLDTHGFEVPILEGAKQTLASANLVIIETYNFHLTPESLLFYEMCAYMKQLGFRCIDISEPMFRKKDRAFWQIDLFFIPLADSAFESNEYA